MVSVEPNVQTPEVSFTSNVFVSSRNGSLQPNFLMSIRLKHVKLGYHCLVSNAMYLLLFPLLAFLSSTDFVQLWTLMQFNLVTLAICSCLVLVFSTLYFTSRPRKVYLVNCSCYKPGSELNVTREMFMEKMAGTGSFTEESFAFQKKILERSGLGQKTYLPEGLVKVPPDPCMAEARKEVEMVMFGAIDELLGKTGVMAKDIGILVVNCCTFSLNPSLSW